MYEFPKGLAVKNTLYVSIVLLEYKISFFYLMPHSSISNYPCVWVILNAAKPFVSEIPIVKLVPLSTSSYLLIFIQNASFEDRTCVLLDIINTSDGQLFLTRRAPALRARLYITPKSISYTDTDTHRHRHRHTQTHTEKYLNL